MFPTKLLIFHHLFPWRRAFLNAAACARTLRRSSDWTLWRRPKAIKSLSAHGRTCRSYLATRSWPSAPNRPLSVSFVETAIYALVMVVRMMRMTMFDDDDGDENDDHGDEDDDGHEDGEGDGDDDQHALCKTLCTTCRLGKSWRHLGSRPWTGRLSSLTPTTPMTAGGT